MSGFLVTPRTHGVAKLLLLLVQYAHAKHPILLVANALEHVLKELAHRTHGLLARVVTLVVLD